MRLALPCLVLFPLAACAQPGFLRTEGTTAPPPLLPVEEILSPISPHLDAEAAAALSARGDALRDRAGSTR